VAQGEGPEFKPQYCEKKPLNFRFIKETKRFKKESHTTAVTYKREEARHTSL
jgi:hypothetical protein